MFTICIIFYIFIEENQPDWLVELNHTMVDIYRYRVFERENRKK